MRQFNTGATRDTDVEKYDYEGFYHPLVVERFGQYMHHHRKQADGNLRDSDNWQRGIPIPVYVKSMLRHVISVWKGWRMQQTISEEEACAILFNVQGMLLESIKRRITNACETSTPVQQDETVQDNNDRCFSGFRAENNGPGDGGQAERDYFEPESLRLYSVPVRDKRVSRRILQGN